MTGILCSLPMIGAPTDASSGTSPVSVSLNKSSVSGTGTASAITTNNVTATASGGAGGYTYSWARVSGNSAISATNANSRTTAFTRTGCAEGTSYSASWRCTATDSSGSIAHSSNVSITITREAEEGGGSDAGTFNGIEDANPTTVAIGSSQTATYSINSDGSITSSGGSPADWNAETDVGASYEVKATVTSGSLTTGTTGSWLALSSNRSWSLTDSTQNNVDETATMTLQIRLVGETSNLDSATITFTANALTSF